MKFIHKYLTLFLGKTIENNQNSHNNKKLKMVMMKNIKRIWKLFFLGDGKYNQHTKRKPPADGNFTINKLTESVKEDFLLLK